MNIYRNLRRMQDMGLINVVPGRPMRFSAIPANIALDMLLSAAKNRVSEMESKYAQILESLSKISSQREEYSIETSFRVHGGRRKVYAVMMRMLEESEREICLLTTPNDLMCLSLYGFDSALKKMSARGVKIKILTNIMDKKMASMLRDYMKYAMIKHSDMQVKTRFLIVDGKSALTSLTIDDSVKLDSESDSGFWTDSPHYIHSIKTFFDMVWRSAQDISVVIQHLKTGKPIEKTIAFSELEGYCESLIGMLDRSESEALICVKRLREPYITRDFIQVMKRAVMRGIKVKILTYLDEEDRNLEEILDAADVRHIDDSHIKVNFLVTDMSESLIYFPFNPTDRRMAQVQCLWSNFVGFAGILSEIFMDLWSKATNSTIKLMEIRFRNAIKGVPETLKSMVEERGWVLEVPATIKGESGLNQRFDMVLRRGSAEEIIVGDFLPEKDDVKMALISLYVRAMDVKAHQKILIMPREELLSADERELAAAYNILLVDGLESNEISRKIIERIESLSESIS